MKNTFKAALLVAAAWGLTLGNAHAYTIGGPASNIYTGSSTWSWQGSALNAFRSAVESDSNFGAGGVVSENVDTVNLSSITSSSLSSVDAFVVPWWHDSYVDCFTHEIKDYFLGGGDLLIFQDDSYHDAVGTALGISTTGSTGTVSNGNSPLFDGAFGSAEDVTQRGNVGQLLDAATIAALGGSVGGTNEQGQITSAYWDDGEYAPGAGKLVIVADIDMISTYYGNVSYDPLNDNGVFALNIVDYLINGSGGGGGGTVPAPATVMLFGLGLLGMRFHARRRQQKES